MFCLTDDFSFGPFCLDLGILALGGGVEGRSGAAATRLTGSFFS